MEDKRNLVIDVLALIEPFRCLDWRTSGDFEKVVNYLNEYFKYNVTGFNEYSLHYDNIEVKDTSIIHSYCSFRDVDNNNPYVLIVFGIPGEIHYSFRYETTLKDCLNNNLSLISFGLKTGSDLYFMKNYISDMMFVREQYIPAKNLIVANLYDYRGYDHDPNKSFRYNYLKKDTSMMNCDSAFAYPCFCSEAYNNGMIYVNKQEDGLYKIDTRDCDGRPVDCEIREGESLYSVYYQYMVDKGYFKEKSVVKVKK